MLYTAILVACLISAPTDCRTHEMLVMGNGIPYSVQIEAQTRAAQWLQEHPGMTMKALRVVAGRGA